MRDRREFLETAVARLIDRCGGYARVAAIFDLSTTTVAKWVDRNEPANRITAHRVWRLEKECGEPVVTEWLALESGCALLRLPPAGLPDAWAEDLAVVMRETADVVQQVAGDLADGRIDRPGEGIREIDEAIAALAALRQRLAAIRDDKGDAP